MSETDEQLLAQWHQGDTAAFEKLFVRYYSLVCQVVHNLVTCRDQAEDLAQETFLTFYNNPPRHLGKANTLVAWLSRVALNRGYNALRGEQRMQQHAERMDMPTDANDPCATVARAEERAHVHATLARLPERQRNMLLLRYAGLSYAEIAATLDVAPGSVGTLLARAERAFLKAHQNRQAAMFLEKGEHHDALL